MFREIKVYETENGKIFKTFEEAEAEEVKEYTKKWYDNHTILGNYAGSKAEWEDVEEWLKENKSVILNYLQGIKDV